MSDYITMKNRIADEMANDGALTVSQISNAIQSAIKSYEREGFWFNQKISTLATVAAQEYYTASDLADIPNMVSVLSMRVEGGGEANVTLPGVDNGLIEDVQDGTVTGDPEYYSRVEDKIRFYPIPDRLMTVKVVYITKLPALVNDTDSNAWVSECEELIRNGAKRRLALEILQADDLAARFTVLERGAYEAIRGENRRRSSQQVLRVNWPFNRGYFDHYRGV